MAKRYSFKTVDKQYYTDHPLGEFYCKDKTEFYLWAPLAENVQIKLWIGSKCLIENMNRIHKGVWEFRINADIDGAYYTYLVTYDGITNETIDIYTRTADANGIRGVVVDPAKADIENWGSQQYIKLDKYTDAVIYELHVRDFSMDDNVRFMNKGKFSAFSETGLTNTYGDSIGLKYIADLGVTHIHLLPVMDFASVDENAPTFNWGYDPLNYNVPEGSYCTCPDDAVGRIRELKNLVAAVHSYGIGVIFDVVYNHTFDAENSPFGKTFPHYYYRHEKGKYSNGSGCGNELASERGMVRRYICDSLCYIAEEYKIDGFRFDLMGLIDIETINYCADKLRTINPDILLYGEGWTGGSSPLSEELRAVKRNAVKLNRIAVFSDDMRDSVKGSVFCSSDAGFANGNADKWHCNMVKSSLIGGIYHKDIDRTKNSCWADTPCQVINYVECHDNLTLCDKLMLSMPQSTENERLAANKMSAALVMLSLGIPFIQAGQEMLRSKPDGNGGFIHNSYNSSDDVNCLKWNDITTNSDIVDYYRGLIAVRKTFQEFHLTDADEIRKAVSFIDLDNGAFIMRNSDVLIVINPSGKEYRLAVGSYDVYVDSQRASHLPLYSGSKKVGIAPHSVYMLKLKKSRN